MRILPFSSFSTDIFRDLATKSSFTTKGKLDQADLGEVSISSDNPPDLFDELSPAKNAANLSVGSCNSRDSFQNKLDHADLAELSISLDVRFPDPPAMNEGIIGM